MNGRSSNFEEVFIIEKTDCVEERRKEIMNTITGILKNYGGNPSKERAEELASTLKEELDNNFDRYWHVVVGKDFSAYMSYSPGSYIQARYGDLTLLLFRLG